ncbi:MAG TPA: hypothetical protein VF581_03810 [Flavobacterium sp.]|jgi:hypothetical protein
MKSFQLLPVVLLLVLFSCSDDKSSPDSVEPEPFVFHFDDQHFTIVSALAVDNKGLTSETHHEYSFLLSDAEITPTFIAGQNPQYQTDGELLLHLRTRSQGEDFHTGTYNICCFNSWFSLTIFRGNDTFSAEEGTVTISGQHPNYKLEFRDIVLINSISDENPVVDDFSYDNGFIFHDNSANN